MKLATRKKGTRDGELVIVSRDLARCVAVPEIARTLEPELQRLIGYAMGSYALGYYTPPLPPGEGPEIVPPEFALGVDGGGYGMGDKDLLSAVSAEVRG